MSPVGHARLRLGVNVDHVATLRQARGTRYPCPVEAARLAMGAGADSITVHLREDRRHIQDADVIALCQRRIAPVNLEMAVTDEMVEFARKHRPEFVCLVPEKRAEKTTEGGLDVAGNLTAVRASVQRMAEVGIQVALFIDADPRQLEAAYKAGAPQLEIHTGRYADAHTDAEMADELGQIRRFAEAAAQAGFEVHAGHGLNVDNVGPIAAIPEIVELNIGHAIVARSVFVGLPAAIAELRARMQEARGR